MLRKLNYTGRKRLQTSDIAIVLEPLGPGRNAFTANLQLGRYRLPKRARILVEAYRHANRMRWDFGTVGAPSHPALHQLELTDFAGTENMLFRVKVVDYEVELGKLLAEASGVRAALPGEGDAERDALLHVRKEHLGERLWRLEIQDEDSELMPCILIHSKLDKASFTHSAEFRALVLPTVVEQILTRLPLQNDAEPESWPARWWNFLGRLGAGTPGSEEDRAEWIDEAVDRFCRKNELMKAYLDGAGTQAE